MWGHIKDLALNMHSLHKQKNILAKGNLEFNAHSKKSAFGFGNKSIKSSD